ncbi:outer membrane protein OmpU [Neisseria gonorrhoeae]|uniref:Outer membrane protein OmpU n=1 Tax=Neisseria gonorrhoeae TaxID=485 RepID=A0A378VW97_NEIGO|nr:outer membrane protein OmpU [Neisseria gonorrhoeae]
MVIFIFILWEDIYACTKQMDAAAFIGKRGIRRRNTARTGLRSRPEFRLHEAEAKPIDREKVPGQVREKGKVLQVDGETLLKIPNCCRVPCIPQWSQTILPVSA